jgi:hypothetical protein
MRFLIDVAIAIVIAVAVGVSSAGLAVDRAPVRGGQGGRLDGMAAEGSSMRTLIPWRCCPPAKCRSAWVKEYRSPPERRRRQAAWPLHTRSR